MCRNEHGATPLHYAAVEGSTDVVKSLIQASRRIRARFVGTVLLRVRQREQGFNKPRSDA